MGNRSSSSTAAVDKKESSSNKNKCEMKPATVVREEKEACGCAVENIDQEEIKVEEEESIEDEEEGVQEPEIVPSSASTMKTRSMIKAPTVCPPGFQPDRFGNCRPVF